MFGYVKTDYPNLYVKDTVLYKACYCGLCKSIGNCCGVNGRFLLNYDMAFLSILLHNVKGIDFNIKKQHCILHCVSKRPMAVVDDLSKRIGALNVILARYKITDNILDNGKGRIKRSFFNKSYKKAKRKEPILDEIVKTKYEQLLSMERENCSSVDMISDAFSNLVKEVVNELMDNNAQTELLNLSYNLGKWIYLIDAVDDFDRDMKKKNFNVFINAYPEAKSKEELLTKEKENVQSIFSCIIDDISEDAKKIKYRFNHDLTDNVFNRGILEQTKKIMRCK